MNATPHIVQSALLLLLAFLIGCLIGYAVRRLVAPRRSATAPSAELAASPARTTIAADDLKKIRGIGPKMEVSLNENGITRYSQIAQWDARTIAEMNERLSSKGRIEREKWVSQAKALQKAQRM